MKTVSKNPRVLVVTPEVTYLPDRMGNLANCLTAKAGGLADVSAALINALFEQGVDVHIALPDYRTLFRDKLAPFLRRERRQIRRAMPDDRVHLAEDRAFYYLNRVYGGGGIENAKLSLAFQREVMNNIIPRVEPDLIHCNDWMTGLIPAMARRLGIPCLFTIHNIHTFKMTLAQVEDRGIDAGDFWQHLFFDRVPRNYEESRENNPVDFLVSGVFASHFVNVVSPTFLQEVIEGRHGFVSGALRAEMANKFYNGCAAGILNAPDPSYNPLEDPYLVMPYGPKNHKAGKRKNKRSLQKMLGLREDINAPLLFWPSRLDPAQKGCQLLAEIFYGLISHYWEMDLQVVFIADGEYQEVFRNIVRRHQFEERVAICDFAEHLEHVAYAAADFILMPSLFEPCGLPQMIAPLYGALPITHDTGGIHDTIRDLDVYNNTGNGFVFKHHNAQGLWWAIGQAMRYYQLPSKLKQQQLSRIMRQSGDTFTHAVTASQYIDLYEKMLQRPLVVNQGMK
ncbi:MAG: glycogen/starch synthase [Desulfobacterales bacterium]|nr:glycogen/starch synthase [Desulfobacterales bacterium]